MPNKEMLIRRRKKQSPVPLILTVVLTLVLIGLLIWCVVLVANQEDTPVPTDSTGNSTQTSSTQTEPSETKPTGTEPTETEPSVTEPTETDPPEEDPPVENPPETKPTEPVSPPKPDPEPTPNPGEKPKDPAVIAAEQKIAAYAEAHGYTLEDYHPKLAELLALKPEAEEYVLNFPMEYGKDHPIDISGYADCEGVPLFIQWDKQWGYLDYAGNVAGLSACGPTSMAMVMYHFTRDPKYTPAYMMQFAESNVNYASKGAGTQWAFFKQGGKELGLDVRELTSEQIGSERMIANIVNSGRIIIMNVKPGVFTTVGHYMLIVGYEDGKFRVNDPNSRVNSETLWEFEVFADQIRMMWSYSM